MNKQKINWVLFVIVTIIAMIFMAQQFLPPPKARAVRIHSVNNIPQLTVTITNSNALPRFSK
jgi:hypothetical protein